MIIKVAASLLNGAVQIELTNDDQEQKVTVMQIVVSGPKQTDSASPALIKEITLAPKGSPGDTAVLDITKTIKRRFKEDGMGEIRISLDLKPEPTGQPDGWSYQASVNGGRVVAFVF